MNERSSETMSSDDDADAKAGQGNKSPSGQREARSRTRQKQHERRLFAQVNRRPDVLWQVSHLLRHRVDVATPLARFCLYAYKATVSRSGRLLPQTTARGHHVRSVYYLVCCRDCGCRKSNDARTACTLLCAPTCVHDANQQPALQRRRFVCAACCALEHLYNAASLSMHTQDARLLAAPDPALQLRTVDARPSAGGGAPPSFRPALASREHRDAPYHNRPSHITCEHVCRKIRLVYLRTNRRQSIGMAGSL